jgi:glycosyltransferase involved in cell wall biosynthesis
MKILMVSMSSIHFFRWTNQLKDAGYEVYWFDINDSSRKVDAISWVYQIVGWRRILKFPGRFFIKKKYPKIYKLIQKLNDRNTAKVFEKVIEEIRPDAVQSFVMYMSCVPILSVMSKFSDIKWIYSAWGNDLFYYRNLPDYRKDIHKVLPKIDYMFADCSRDIKIAKEMGLKGKNLGVFPGGGGYEIKNYLEYYIPFNERKVILIKGYEQRFGRAINVIKSLLRIKNELHDYKVVIFGADDEFYENYKLVSNVDFIDIKGKITHEEVLKLMGESLIYLGNSISDGMPNTLLEAIIMGAFPIQSNPGKASEEIIEDGINGFLINDPENLEEISQKIISALFNQDLLIKAMKYNKKVQQQLEYNYIRDRVLNKYTLVENDISQQRIKLNN